MPIDDLQAAAQKIAGFINTLNKLGGLRLKYRITAGDGARDPEGLEGRQIYIELGGPDVPLVTQHNGELLRALETIAAQMLRSRVSEFSAIDWPKAVGADLRKFLLQILERLCAAETPPIRLVSNQLGGINSLGSDYASIDVSVELQCSIEQLVNLLATIAVQPELISTTDLRVTSANNPKEKIMGVHLGVSGVVPRKLLGEKTSEKKGAGI